MIKKFFAAAWLIATILLSGCFDAVEDHNSHHNNAQASTVAKNVPNFTTITITGETVTNEIFASKKITIVNIWGTFCPPCIGEMPALGEMDRSLPKDAQIIGLICDASEKSPQIKRALEITQKAGVNFINIVPDAQLMEFMAGVEAVPTTIFVNSKGEVVGNVIVGANVEAYKDELEKLLQE